MDELCFEENHILFGSDQTERIVAAELAGRFIRLFIHDADGVKFKDDPFHPFILLTDPAHLTGFPGEFTLKKLQGNGEYRFIASFRDWRDCMAARDHLAKEIGKNTATSNASYLYISDPVHQHFLVTGKTLFKGMEFSSLRRLALDIETFCAEGFEFSNPARLEDRITSIALMDNCGYKKVLFGNEMEEAEMLSRLTSIIRERNPDVIEGHNIFRFDLEYIRVRAARYGIKLQWGRDGSEPRVHSSRFTIAERIIDYPRWDIYGRHIIDSYFLLQIYDIGSREMESYGLKAAAIHFGLAAPDRVYLDPHKLNLAYTEDPESLKKYNLDDVRETLSLSRLLSYPVFLQTRMFPYSYQNCVIRGNATKINALFLREYLRRDTAIPKPSTGGSFEGGYNNVFINGVVGPIVHCDVTSLYPSLLLTYDLWPAGDSLGLFLPILKELREFRLAAKKHARSESTPPLRDYYQALQQTFKTLINSFYGYLGTTIHNFSDLPLAAEVTRLGRETIHSMLAWLEAKGARPVEVDTDGIYFIPPKGVTSAEQEEALVHDLSQTLPAGIDVDLDGRYQAIFSYKMKNYALLGYDGRITIKGSGLKSRGIEKYLREYMYEMISLLLHDKGDKVEQLYCSYLEKLKEHQFPIDWLAKTETLSESPDGYHAKVKQGKRNPAAAFEIALKSAHEYRAGDQISYYVAGHGKGVAAYENCCPVSGYDPAHPDENLLYYIEKLSRLYKKFMPFLPQEKTLFD
jgi:DNA polymerase elongation subunit (family B)